MRFIIPTLLVSFLLVGCGDKQAANKADSNQTALTVTKADGSKTTITCPSKDERCPKITRKALRPIASDRVCAQIYGGPEKASVVGTVNGERVDLSLSRTDSCRIAQWDRLSWLVGPVQDVPLDGSSPR